MKLALITFLALCPACSDPTVKEDCMRIGGEWNGKYCYVVFVGERV